jgi:hypothetical protein
VSAGPARHLLDGWEAVRGEPLPVRAAALAALAAQRTLDEALRWSIPARDRVLFAFRARVFGDAIEAVTRCPHCDEPLEMQLSLADVRPRATGRKTPATRTLRIGRRRIRWRLPTTEDLLAVGHLSNPDEARNLLLERCIQCSDAAVRERAAALLPAEPTDVRFTLVCPACAHTWSTPFDIAQFAWREVDEWAQRTLDEIHVLARAYGWTEGEILSLGARRRRTYVEMNQ